MINKAKMLEALAGEKALCDGELCVGRGQERISCFWGALLVHIGYENWQLRDLDPSLVGMESAGARADILREYGAGPNEIAYFMVLNDNQDEWTPFLTQEEREERPWWSDKMADYVRLKVLRRAIEAFGEGNGNATVS